MCEATFWTVLIDNGVSVSPNRDLAGSRKTPDFLCHKNGIKFYVEVTCIQEDTATRHTLLEPDVTGHSGARHFELLNRAIANECTTKTVQCANLDAPCILAIGTFHYQASVLTVQKDAIESLLTGEVGIGFDFDAKAGRIADAPYEVTCFRWSPFTRESESSGAEFMRRPLSAVLIGGLGCSPNRIFGALHPCPAMEFDPTILDRIEFCRQRIDWNSRRVGTDWIQRSAAPLG